MVFWCFFQPCALTPDALFRFCSLSLTSFHCAAAGGTQNKQPWFVAFWAMLFLVLLGGGCKVKLWFIRSWAELTSSMFVFGHAQSRKSESWSRKCEMHMGAGCDWLEEDWTSHQDVAGHQIKVWKRHQYATMQSPFSSEILRACKEFLTAFHLSSWWHSASSSASSRSLFRLAWWSLVVECFFRVVSSVKYWPRCAIIIIDRDCYVSYFAIEKNNK